MHELSAGRLNLKYNAYILKQKDEKRNQKNSINFHLVKALILSIVSTLFAIENLCINVKKCQEMKLLQKVFADQLLSN